MIGVSLTGPPDARNKHVPETVDDAATAPLAGLVTRELAHADLPAASSRVHRPRSRAAELKRRRNARANLHCIKYAVRNAVRASRSSGRLPREAQVSLRWVGLSEAVPVLQVRAITLPEDANEWQVLNALRRAADSVIRTSGGGLDLDVTVPFVIDVTVPDNVRVVPARRKPATKVSADR